MPHAIIEYSDNLAADFRSKGISKAVHSVLTESGLFKPTDIRTRAYPAQDFLVGEKEKDGRFVHVVAYIMEGRTVEQKQSLTQSIIDKVGHILKNVDFISADVRDLMKDVYRKTSS